MLLIPIEPGPEVMGIVSYVLNIELAIVYVPLSPSTLFFGNDEITLDYVLPTTDNMEMQVNGHFSMAGLAPVSDLLFAVRKNSLNIFSFHENWNKFFFNGPFCPGLPFRPTYRSTQNMIYC